MAKFQFDKRQLVPAAAMGVASVGLFGYFVLKMTAPPPLQAAPQGAKAGAQVASTDISRPAPGAPNSAAPGAQGATPTDPLMGAPTGAIRDPFAPAIIDNSNLPAPVKVASSKTSFDRLPGVPGGLPSMGSVPPMGLAPGSRLPGLGPSQPETPQWTVTGVISTSSEPNNRVAILRNGDVRRFVRMGDMVDGTFRLADVTRTGVVLTRGSERFRLPLGGGKSNEPKHTAVPNGAATGPWQGGPTSSAAQPGASTPAPAPATAPAQTPASVPSPTLVSPTPGLN